MTTQCAGSGPTRPRSELGVGAPDAPLVSVVLSPQHSVVSLLLQMASGQSLGAPAGLLAAVRDGLRPQARFAAQALSGGVWSPDCCMQGSSLGDTSVADQAARMRDMPVTALTSELHAAGGSPDYSPAHWRGAADHPRRWLNSMADASLDTWAIAEPLWRAAGPALDREIRRIGAAAVRGGMTALLNSLHPRISYHDGTFVVIRRNRSVTRSPVGPRRLALVPMIAGHDALLISSCRPEFFAIGYPVGQARAGTQAIPESTLETLLGPVRAAILRAVLQPLSVSELAAAVHCAPSTATYHLQQLAAVGLITRHKTGPSVRVSRTARGHELVDLLSDLLLRPASVATQ
jgi:DNA-binding transcriptional ArsR family regulator